MTFFEGGTQLVTSQPDPQAQGRDNLPRESVRALPLTPAEDRRWAYVAHSFSIAGFLPSLCVYLAFRDRGPFTRQESREAFNFTLPLTVLVVIFLGLGFLPGIGLIFSLVAVLIWLFMTISGVLGGVQVNKGRPYLYKLNLRMFLYE